MVKLVIGQIEGILPFVEEGIADHPLGDRLDSAYMLAFLNMLVSSNTGAVFVDSASKPTYGFVATVGKLGITDERNCFINVVYSSPEARNSKCSKSLQATIEAYAKSEKCDLIRGASSRYKDSENIDHFWESMGAKPEELVFIKKLN